MMVEEMLILLTSGFVAVMILMTIGVMVYMIIKASKGGSRPGAETEDETRMIQEIHHGLTKMQKRVEALETLLLDDERVKRDKFDRELNKD